MLIQAAPKYGNDDGYVDSLVRRAYDVYLDGLSRYRNTRYSRGPIGGTSSNSANVPQGAGTTATPRWTQGATPLAEGCSSSHAMDQKGLPQYSNRYPSCRRISSLAAYF